MLTIPDIQTLIPQRPPFVMISELIECNENDTRSRFTVQADNLFMEGNQLREPALVENIAQTAAARAGYLALLEQRPVTLGYIGAIQQLEIFGLPGTGDSLDTEIKVINQVFDVTVISGKVSCRGKVLATCEMKIFITKQS
jgi:3-hydroxymyristoyl/3-hydroxydecanoyl-(acyl carrier protein) dehydratase